MNFYFTRHGETEWNVKKKIQGTTDIPLDEKGIQQAKRLAETLLEKQRNGELHLDRVYTSPQLRAAETARFSAEALGIDCIRLWDLREMDLGDWEGRNWDEIRETEAERHHIWDTHRRFCHTPGGECYNEVLRRTLAALEQILTCEKDDVLVVTHSAVLMALRCYLADRPFDVMREYRTRNTELVRVTEEKIREIVTLIPDDWLHWSESPGRPQEIREIYIRFLCERLAHSETFIKEAQDARKALI